jgi:hypothetical protein
VFETHASMCVEPPIPTPTARQDITTILERTQPGLWTDRAPTSTSLKHPLISSRFYTVLSISAAMMTFGQPRLNLAIVGYSESKVYRRLQSEYLSIESERALSS